LKRPATSLTVLLEGGRQSVRNLLVEAIYVTEATEATKVTKMP
jgi:hypothetical protein